MHLLKQKNHRIRRVIFQIFTNTINRNFFTLHFYFSKISCQSSAATPLAHSTARLHSTPKTSIKPFSNSTSLPHSTQLTHSTQMARTKTTGRKYQVSESLETSPQETPNQEPTIIPSTTKDHTPSKSEKKKKKKKSKSSKKHDHPNPTQTSIS